MLVANSKQKIRNFIQKVKSEGKKVAFVPTMGALHQGHLSLLEVAKQKADVVVASIFVNPAQFGPKEDFGNYPRQVEEDNELLKQAGCDAVFIPDVKEVYGEHFSLQFHVTNSADIMCGAVRPGHFDGVAIVVAKLFNIVQPDIAVFGEKDYQQLFIIKQMVKDLNFDIEIVGAPNKREESGLAMSSRNAYLDEDELHIAEKFNKGLKQAVEKLKQGASISAVIEETKDYLLSVGFSNIDYIDVRNENNLEAVEQVDEKSRILAAAWIGRTRLIDNMKIFE